MLSCTVKKTNGQKEQTKTEQGHLEIGQDDAPEDQRSGAGPSAPGLPTPPAPTDFRGPPIPAVEYRAMIRPLTPVSKLGVDPLLFRATVLVTDTSFPGQETCCLTCFNQARVCSLLLALWAHITLRLQRMAALLLLLRETSCPDVFGQLNLTSPSKGGPAFLKKKKNAVGLLLLNPELEANFFYKRLYSKYPLRASGLGYKYLKHESSQRESVLKKMGVAMFQYNSIYKTQVVAGLWTPALSRSAESRNWLWLVSFLHLSHIPHKLYYQNRKRLGFPTSNIFTAY